MVAFPCWAAFGVSRAASSLTSATHRHFIPWGSTPILPPLLISANYSAVHHSLLSSLITSAWSAWLSAVTERLVPHPTDNLWPDTLPSSADSYCSSVWTANQQITNHHFLCVHIYGSRFVCVCVFSFTLHKTLMFVITHLWQNSLGAWKFFIIFINFLNPVALI